jgi:hypothetical protein
MLFYEFCNKTLLNSRVFHVDILHLIKEKFLKTLYCKDCKQIIYINLHEIIPKVVDSQVDAKFNEWFS